MNIKELLSETSIPNQNEEPVFAEPWQAKAFAIVLQLAEANVFEWRDWVECFSSEVAKAEQGDYQPDTDYYPCWVRALEKLLADKGLADGSGIESAIETTLANWPHPDHVAQKEPVHISPAIV